MRIKLLVTTLLLSLPALAGAADYKTKNLVLVTTDGLRWQEVFQGMDPALKDLDEAGMKDADELRAALWADTPEERRDLLMPFLWSGIASQGVILGNGERGAAVTLRNQHRFSYPGYSEILTGRPQDDVIDSNALRPNPSATVLEVLRREWKLPRTQVALFGSWYVFQGIGAHDPEAVFINAGSQRLEMAGASKRLQELSSMQFQILTPWPGVRHDYVTFEMALEYLKTSKPRVLYIALDETDDWAHARRYDRTLQAAQYVDACLRGLWEAIQSDDAYRDSTTLIVATDHGRGSTPQDYNSHGVKIEAAERVWIAAMGPDTPAVGEARDVAGVTQSDIAPTMLELAGIDYRKLAEVEGKPIDVIVGR